ncbi:MAG: GDSL lipase/esterase [Benjaminiella poitrasii]|nr:MAG: GDSL lipase/esterase [Benjaminiella poitrasii]
MKLLSLIPFITLSASAVSAFDKIIAYADSFSDNGNDYRSSAFPPSPPYFEGRFSNGPTWLEYVNENLTGIALINNGHGGATTNNADVYSQFNNWIVPGLKQQIETTYVNGTADDLYLIYIGYNDLNAIVNPDQYTIVNKNYTKEKVCQNVVEGVQTLVNMYGAKNFLVLNVPPFDQWPVIADAEKESTKKMINDYNALLETELPKNIPNVDFKFLDDYSWFEEQLAHPEALLLSTSNGPCCWGIGNTSCCDDPETHFFWDSYHPEAKVHEAFGAWATKQIKSLYKMN